MFGLLYKGRKTKIRLSDDALIIENYFLGKISSKEYSLSKIENLSYNRLVKSNYSISTSSTKIKILGIDLSPESSNEHYHHNEIISFKYAEDIVEIGKWKKYFDGESLFNLLNENTLLIEKPSSTYQQSKKAYKK